MATLKNCLPIGTKKNFWTVKEHLKGYGKNSIFYLVECICGFTRQCDTGLLNDTKSCGCMKGKLIADKISKNVTVKNTTKNLTQWAKEEKISLSGMSRRISRKGTPLKTETGKLKITFNNETHTLSAWSKILNIKTVTLLHRHRKGLPLDHDCSTGINVNSRKFVRDNKELTLKQWANELNIKYSTLRCRVYQGWDFNEAINKALTEQSRKVITRNNIKKRIENDLHFA